jgi:predicted  nucleic acid-binding Zn-ribbon protein
MIDGLSDVMTPRPPAQASESDSDRTVESVALAGAAAIQRLITDRDSLRERVNIQQRELVALSSLNEDLRRRINLVRHHYVELGTKVLAQLEQFDQAFRDAIQDKPETAAASSDHANLIALANRLKPNRG